MRPLSVYGYQKDELHPVVFVQHEAIDGVWDEQAIERALEHALRRHRLAMADRANAPKPALSTVAD